MGLVRLVYTWIDGENAAVAELGDLVQAARTLAGFVNALQAIDVAGGPPPGNHNVYRGVPLAERDAETRSGIAALEGIVDQEAVTDEWERALRTPGWDRAPAWLHGDLYAANLLVRDGELSGVIDFGGLGVGDPACDLMSAWTLFSGESRDAFREALGVDEATWIRGRGWILSWALIALPYYLTTNPVIVRNAKAAIAAVLEDV